MNLGYWLEQIKATTAIAAHLAVPITIAGTPSPTPTASAGVTVTPSATPAPSASDGLYLPMIIKDV